MDLQVGKDSWELGNWELVIIYRLGWSNPPPLH